MLTESLAAVLIASSAATAGAAPAEPKKETIEASVLATAKDYSGKDCRILALRGVMLGEPAGDLEHVAQGGVTLLHAAPSGGMKVLVASGTWSIPTRRISYHQRRVLGVAADAERLYVVLWDSGRIWDHPPVADTKLSGGTYSLMVFTLPEGRKIEELGQLKGPDKPTAETLDKGPLTVGENSVTVYGETYKFKGWHLVK